VLNRSFEAAFAINHHLQGGDFLVAIQTCVRGSALRRLPVRLLQLSVKARLAHSACFAAVALREVMTAGRTIELRAGRRTVALRNGDRFRPALDALLTDDSVTSDAEPGHPPAHRPG
jgi:hypothetical protein